MSPREEFGNNGQTGEMRMMASDPKRYAEIRRVTLHGAAVNAVIATFKLIFGFIGHSQALIADGFHSLSDLSNDFLLLLAAKHASRGADDDHPYGHGRIETLFSVGQGLMLGGIGIAIGIDAVRRLFNPELLLQPKLSALLIALLALVFKEALYHYTMRAAKRLRSSMLRGNAWDHRSDAVSSLLVVVGVAGSLAGLTYLDAVAAVAVALMVVKIGWNLVFHAVKDLIDTGLEAERVEAIRNAILAVDGVRHFHHLRTRRMGPDALVDVHIQVDPLLSVSEGHFISETVRQRIISEIDEVQDVLVHIDAENDEESIRCHQLPGRRRVYEILERAWSDLIAASTIKRMTLHYIGGKIAVEVTLPLSAVSSPADGERLRRQMQTAIAGSEQIGRIDVSFS